MGSLFLILNDITSILTSISVLDLVVPTLFLLWLLALVLPINADRKDKVAQATYSVIMSTIGVIFVYALPYTLFKITSSYSAQVFGCIALVVISASRWQTNLRSMLKEVKYITHYEVEKKHTPIAANNSLRHRR